MAHPVAILLASAVTLLPSRILSSDLRCAVITWAWMGGSPANRWTEVRPMEEWGFEQRPVLVLRNPLARPCEGRPGTGDLRGGP